MVPGQGAQPGLPEAPGWVGDTSRLQQHQALEQQEGPQPNLRLLCGAPEYKLTPLFHAELLIAPQVSHFLFLYTSRLCACCSHCLKQQSSLPKLESWGRPRRCFPDPSGRADCLLGCHRSLESVKQSSPTPTLIRLSVPGPYRSLYLPVAIRQHSAGILPICPWLYPQNLAHSRCSVNNFQTNPRDPAQRVAYDQWSLICQRSHSGPEACWD